MNDKQVYWRKRAIGKLGMINRQLDLDLDDIIRRMSWVNLDTKEALKATDQITQGIQNLVKAIVSAKELKGGE